LSLARIAERLGRSQPLLMNPTRRDRNETV